MKELNRQNSTYFVTILVLVYILISIYFFIGTVFFSSANKMVYPRYIPENKNIGNDLLLDYRFGYRYFVEHKSAYIGDDTNNWYTQNAYPPMFTYFLYPFYLFNASYLSGYHLIAPLIILSFLWMVLILPYFYHKKLELPPAAIFAACTGILSYGIQFALERGQFDMICIALCLTSITLFWVFPKLRLLAYVLFILAFQFKIYPIVFILCFFENWRDLKKNAIRIGGICLAIFLSLFVMGIKGFTEFLRALTWQTASGAYSRDHGINYGIDYLTTILGINLSLHSQIAVKLVVELIGFILLLSVFIIYLKKERKGGLFPPLLLGCMLAAMALFPASKDYKLAMIVSVFCMYVIYLEREITYLPRTNKIQIYGLFSVMAFCYASIQFSEAYRPAVLKNSFPFLYLMLILLVAIETIILHRSKTPHSLQ